MTANLLHELYEEYEKFYFNMADAYEVPRAITGVADDGEQFTFAIDGYELNHIERDAFIKVILREEKSTIFAYGTLTGSYDDTGELIKFLEIVVATSTDYIHGTYEVIEDLDVVKLIKKDISEGTNPDSPGLWFLSDQSNLHGEDAMKYKDMWHSLKDVVMRRQRW